MDTIERALQKRQAEEQEAKSSQREDALTEERKPDDSSSAIQAEQSLIEEPPVADSTIAAAIDAESGKAAAPEQSVEHEEKVESEEAKAPEKANALDKEIAPEEKTEPKSNQVPLRQNQAKNMFNLDLAELARAGVIIPDDKRSKIKEEYKHIKRPLLQKAAIDAPQNGHENLIMVTSAYSGEGKTFSSLNLAMSIAVERDRRVLLIDADVVKPGLGRLLGIDQRPGLVEYLNGDEADLASIMLPTNVHNLTVMPAGKTHHLSHELLASNAMKELADELASRYKDRVIIFDSSPLLATSESRVLSRLVGQVAVVVEQDKTSQTAVQDAISCIEREKITGLILNKSQTGSDSYYGYYYSNAE